MLCLAPSFSTDIMLRQISSNASANTITVSIPEIDESDGPIRLVIDRRYVYCTHYLIL